MFKKKKSSLSLSINAIVVLILAITMLGLGLGFIRTMFGKVTDITEEQLSAEPDPAIPNINDPITLSKDIVMIDKGTTRVIKYAVYCGLATNCATPVAVAASTICTKVLTADTATPTLSASPLSAGIVLGAYTKGTILISVPSTSVSSGVASCTVTVGGIAASNKATSFAVTVK